MDEIGEVVLAVGSGQFQLVTICNQLTSFLGETVLQNLPIVSGSVVVRLLGEDLDDVHDRENLSLGFLIVEAADFAIFENGGDDFYGSFN